MGNKWVSQFQVFVYLLFTCLLFTDVAHAAKDNQCAWIPSADFVDSHVKSLTVPIKRLHLRTVDGRNLKLDIMASVNLLDLKFIGRGILFTVPLSGADGAPLDQTLPVGAMALEVYAKGHSELTTDGAVLCHMKEPHSIEVLLPRVAMIRTNVVYLIKVAMPASALLQFKPSGTPCKIAQMKCDVPDEIQAFAVNAMFDEF